MIDGIEINELKIIENKNGNILHFLKNNEKSYKGFGEVYISTIKSNSIKAWKKHKKMTCNFIVPKGKIKIVVFDDRLDSISYNEIQEINLSNLLRASEIVRNTFAKRNADGSFRLEIEGLHTREAFEAVLVFIESELGTEWVFFLSSEAMTSHASFNSLRILTPSSNTEMSFLRSPSRSLLVR